MGVISHKRREQNRIIHILGTSHDLVFLFSQNVAMYNGKFHCYKFWWKFWAPFALLAWRSRHKDVKEMSKKRLKKVLIVANDTDVVVIAVAHFFLLDLEELWVRHGAGTKTRFIAVHELAGALEEVKARTVLFFHAFTGCDQVSYLAKLAWSDGMFRCIE